MNDPQRINARGAAAASAIAAERARADEPEAAQVGLRERGPMPPAGSPTFDVYANGSDRLAPPALEISVEPPSNELVASPRIELTQLKAVPRPFGTAEER